MSEQSPLAAPIPGHSELERLVNRSRLIGADPSEIARGNNDANVIVLGAKVIAPDAAERILDTWLSTEFRGGRHAERVAQIAKLERGEPLP